MTLGATLTTSFLVTLARPSTWPLALAAFLLRGGLLLVLAPILVLPSAVGMANVVGPLLTTFVFAGLTPEILVTGLALAAVVGAWILAGGLVAGAAEAELIRIVATDEEVAVGDVPPVGLAGSARILAVHLLAQSPLALAVVWGGTRIVAVTYREFTLPSDVTVPVAARVVADVPEAIAVIAVAWWLGQVVGSVASRRVVLRAAGVPRALASASTWSIRHPGRAAALEFVPTAALIAVVAPSAAASAAAWQAVRESFATNAGPLDTIAHVVLLAALWTGGLVLVALVAAWRAAAWTVEAAGTFGVPGSAERGTGPDPVGLAR